MTNQPDTPYRITNRGRAILERERRILVKEIEDNEVSRRHYLEAADKCIAAIRQAEKTIEDIDLWLKEGTI